MSPTKVKTVQTNMDIEPLMEVEESGSEGEKSITPFSSIISILCNYTSVLTS